MLKHLLKQTLQSIQLIPFNSLCTEGEYYTSKYRVLFLICMPDSPSSLQPKTVKLPSVYTQALEQSKAPKSHSQNNFLIQIFLEFITVISQEIYVRRIKCGKGA